MFMEDVNDQHAVEGAADLPEAEALPADAPQAPSVGATRHGGPERAPRAGKAIIRCSATTKAGRPCTNAAGPDGHCIAHSKSPQTLATVQAARAAGGRAPRVRVGLDQAVAEGLSLADGEAQVRVLEAATRALAQGRISSTVAAAIAQLVRTAATIVQADQQAAIAELERRVQELVDARVVPVRR